MQFKQQGRPAENDNMRMAASVEAKNMEQQEKIARDVDIWIEKNSDVLQRDEWGQLPLSWRASTLKSLLVELFEETAMPDPGYADCSAEPYSPALLTSAMERFMENHSGIFTQYAPQYDGALEKRALILGNIVRDIVSSSPELSSISRRIWDSAQDTDLRANSLENPS
ncbi:MAG: hypothetical protein OEZ59_03850 [Deltaproteobacteria bacterium]|nr:hypothetical protein [Deltaproteobacteria bacterium]